jgi:hypothetical protein
LLLAGFVLAHSAWSVSDAPELLVPLAIIERNGRRKIMRFEASTQEEAIAQGKAMTASLSADVDEWAFAREGLLDEDSGKVDIISVDIGIKGSAQRVALIQRFEPYTKRHHFRLLGDTQTVIDGHIQEPAKAKGLAEIVRRGVSQHSKVAPLWDGWHKA